MTVQCLTLEAHEKTRLPLALRLHPGPFENLPRAMKVPREFLKPGALQEHVTLTLLRHLLQNKPTGT